MFKIGILSWNYIKISISYWQSKIIWPSNIARSFQMSIILVRDKQNKNGAISQDLTAVIIQNCATAQCLIQVVDLYIPRFGLIFSCHGPQFYEPRQKWSKMFDRRCLISSYNYKDFLNIKQILVTKPDIFTISNCLLKANSVEMLNWFNCKHLS